MSMKKRLMFDVKFDKQAGFTLLEILVAMVILAVAGIAIITSSSSHIRIQSFLQKNLFTQWVASNRLAEIKLERKWPIDNNKRGSMKLAGEEYHWQQSIQKTNDKNMVKVDVAVYENEDYESSILSLSTYIAHQK